MCSLKAAQIHGRRIRATKITCAAFVCTRFPYTLRQKDLISPKIMNHGSAPFHWRVVQNQAKLMSVMLSIGKDY